MSSAELITLLSDFSVFGAAAMLIALICFLFEKGGDRRPDLDAQRKESELARFDASYTLAGYRRTMTLGGIGSAVLILLSTRNVIFALIPFTAGIVLPLLYPWYIKRGYMNKFEEGFSECLEIWTRCVQAGLSLQQAVKVTSNDMVGPAAKEMGILQKEMSLGDVDGALWHFYDRMPTEDVRYAVLGVITCRQTGGKMSDVIAKIAESIRERAGQRERINAITSMGRSEAYIMGAMPVAIGFLMYLLEPETVALLFTNIYGIIGTIGAICWEGIGLLIIWNIVNVKP